MAQKYNYLFYFEDCHKTFNSELRKDITTTYHDLKCLLLKVLYPSTPKDVMAYSLENVPSLTQEE